ncbi:MAG: hypothetical protein ACEQSX_18035, partial [Baekduiaceae bacterium]
IMTSETIITDPVPVPQKPRQGAGRPAEPNPFLADVRVIAGKLNPRTGQAMAVRETFVLDASRGETVKQRYSRVRRKLTAAGEVVAAERGRDEPYRIGMDIAPDEREGPGSFVLTFWDREVKA